MRPIKLQGVKPEAMSQEEWGELDELARSTIILILSKSIYFNVKDIKTTYEIWKKLCDLYNQKSAASQVYWLKQLVDLKMKEGASMYNHLNEFNTIYQSAQCTGGGVSRLSESIVLAYHIARELRYLLYSAR